MLPTAKQDSQCFILHKLCAAVFILSISGIPYYERMPPNYGNTHEGCKLQNNCNISTATFHILLYPRYISVILIFHTVAAKYGAVLSLMNATSPCVTHMRIN
jgi:hypothetical protein